MYEVSPYIVGIPNRPDIIEGLRNGTLVITGGVIRDLKGRIAAHLVDIGDTKTIQEWLNKLPPDIELKLSTIGTIQYLSLGLSVLNLTAITISTVHLSKKLIEISNKIDDVLNHVKEIYIDVKDIKDLLIYKDLIKAAQRYGDIHSFKDPILREKEIQSIIDAIEESLAIFSIIIEKIANYSEDLPNIINKLIPLIRMYIYASDLRGKVYMDLNELDVSHSKYKKSVEFIKTFHNKILSAIYPDKGYLQMPILPETQIELKKNFIANEFLKSRALEIQNLKEIGLNIDEYKKLTENKEEGIYLLVYDTKNKFI